MQDKVATLQLGTQHSKVIFKDFRLGDVKHSLASIQKAKKLLGYSPTHNVKDGLSETIDWYFKEMKAAIEE